MTASVKSSLASPPPRIIARLDIKAPNLVKGIHLEGLRVIGRPGDFAKRYFEAGADELFYQDIVASLYQRSSIVDLVKQTAEMIFVPLTVGGGIRSIQDIQTMLRAGADKVCVNTAATTRPEFISEAAAIFGRQCIVVAIEVLKQTSGKYLVFTNNGRQSTGLEAREWACRAVDCGAGEIVITSVDREGTRRGLDLGLIEEIVGAVGVPVIAHGGVGHAGHVLEAVRLGASGVAVAKALHSDALSIAEIKNHLVAAGVEVRR